MYGRYNLDCDSKIILALLLIYPTEYDFSNYSCKNVCVIFLIIFFRNKIWNYKMLRIWLGYQPQRIKNLASVRYEFSWKYFLFRKKRLRSLDVTKAAQKQNLVKVHTFWEGHKILRNLHCRFVLWPSHNIWSLSIKLSRG